VYFLIVRVARELDYLAPIDERRCDRIEGIGRTDEENLRKVNRDVDVVILSIIRILLRGRIKV
jgi:hypothetical protein